MEYIKKSKERYQKKFIDWKGTPHHMLERFLEQELKGLLQEIVEKVEGMKKECYCKGGKYCHPCINNEALDQVIKLL